MIDLFKWNEFKLPKVTYRKLGRDRCFGYQHKNSIHIDERLQGKERFEIEIHELLHYIYPDKDEDSIRKESRMITDFLWNLNYRRTDQ